MIFEIGGQFVIIKNRGKFNFQNKEGYQRNSYMALGLSQLNVSQIK